MGFCFYYCSPSPFSYAEKSIFAYATEDSACTFFFPIIEKSQVLKDTSIQERKKSSTSEVTGHITENSDKQFVNHP